MGEEPQLGQLWEELASQHHFYLADMVSSGGLKASELGTTSPDCRHRLNEQANDDRAVLAGGGKVHVPSLVETLRLSFKEDASQWRLFFEVWDDCSIREAVWLVKATL